MCVFVLCGDVLQLLLHLLPSHPRSLPSVGGEEEVATDKNQQNLEEFERVSISIFATLAAFRLRCAQIRPVFSKIIVRGGP